MRYFPFFLTILVVSCGATTQDADRFRGGSQPYQKVETGEKDPISFRDPDVDATDRGNRTIPKDVPKDGEGEPFEPYTDRGRPEDPRNPLPVPQLPEDPVTREKIPLKNLHYFHRCDGQVYKQVADANTNVRWQAVGRQDSVVGQEKERIAVKISGEVCMESGKKLTIFLIDQSGSMGPHHASSTGYDPIRADGRSGRMDALETIVKGSSRTEDGFAFVPFASQVRNTSIRSPLAADAFLGRATPQVVSDFVPQGQVGAGTNYRAAIEEAQRIAENNTSLYNRIEVVLITDGQPMDDFRGTDPAAKERAIESARRAAMQAAESIRQSSRIESALTFHAVFLNVNNEFAQAKEILVALTGSSERVYPVADTAALGRIAADFVKPEFNTSREHLDKAFEVAIDAYTAVNNRNVLVPGLLRFEEQEDQSKVGAVKWVYESQKFLLHQPIEVIADGRTRARKGVAVKHQTVVKIRGLNESMQDHRLQINYRIQ